MRSACEGKENITLLYGLLCQEQQALYNRVEQLLLLGSDEYTSKWPRSEESAVQTVCLKIKLSSIFHTEPTS